MDNLKQPYILLIEKNPIVREAIKLQLESSGFHLLGMVENGLEGIYILPRNHAGPDMVLIHHSDAHNWDNNLIPTIFRFLHPTKILLLSSALVPNVPNECKVLRKPFTRFQLQKAIWNLLNH